MIGLRFALALVLLPCALTAMETVLRVDGMVCPNCTGAITEGLRKLPDVTRVRADLDNGEIAVCAEASVTAAELRRVITELGFSVVAEERRDPETDAVLRELQSHLRGEMPSAVFTARVARTRDADGHEVLWFQLTFPPLLAEAWLALLDEGEHPLAVALEAAPVWAQALEESGTAHDASRLCREPGAVAVLAANRASLLLRLHPEPDTKE